jgi:amidase
MDGQHSFARDVDVAVQYVAAEHDLTRWCAGAAWETPGRPCLYCADVAATDLVMASAVDLAAAIRAKTVSSRELLDAFVDQIDRIDGEINAVSTRDLERATEAAAAADGVTAAGQPTGPLHGLPITLKDALEVSGVRSTGGATELAENVPDRDAPIVAAVRAAGAIPFARTNLPRWSGDIQTFNDLFGTTNNPWDLSRVPGGSSGGAGAAVTTGMTSFEIGTDIGGSIRIPAAFNGIFGHKPTFGATPSTGYLDEPLGGGTVADVNVIGPLARSAADLALLMNVMAGPTSDQAAGWSLALPPPRQTELGDLRIAAWLDDPACPVSSDQLEIFDRAIGALESDGARVDRTARPSVDLAAAARLGLLLIGSAVSLSVDDDIAAELARSSSGGGLTLSHRDWLKLHREREQMRGQWAAFFEDYDVLLAPVCPSPPFPHNQPGNMASRIVSIDGVDRPYTDLVTWTVAIGVNYLPVSVPPLGTNPDGLPVGIQIVGPHLGDRTCIQLASHVERVVGGHRPPPIALR